MFFFFQAEDGIRDRNVTGVQTCALPIFLEKLPCNTSESFNRPMLGLPNCARHKDHKRFRLRNAALLQQAIHPHSGLRRRSEEHTSELQSRFDLVCRLLLEKKNKNKNNNN